MKHSLPSLSDTLVRLEHALHDINPVLCQRLQPGLSVANITEIFDSLKLDAPEDLITLYSWHNGIAYEAVPSGLIKFCPEGIFMPLQDISIDYNDAIWEEGPLYDKIYFPITNSDALLYNMSLGDLYFYAPSLLITEPKKTYESLGSYFYTILKAIDFKIIQYDSNGQFLLDYKAFQLLASEINLSHKAN